MQNQYLYDQSLSHCQWWMALSAPHTITNANIYDFFSLGLRKDNPDIEEWQQGLQNGWGIEDRADFLVMIMRLIKGEIHGEELMTELDLKHFASPSQWHSFIRNITDDIELTRAQFVDILYHHCGIGGLKGWDYTRAGFLIRAGYYCEHFSQDEACYMLNLAARQAQRHYSNWQQYLKCGILGRNFWLFNNKTRSGKLADWGYKLLNRGIDYEYDTYYRDLAPYQEFFRQLDWHTPLPDLTMPESLSTLLMPRRAA